MAVVALAMLSASGAAVSESKENCLPIAGEAIMKIAYPSAKVASVYLRIVNPCNQQHTLVAASSSDAKRVEIHETVENDEGVLSMRPVQEGIVIPSDSELTLDPGGLHLMIMGLNQTGSEYDAIDLKLEFNNIEYLNISAARMN